MGHAIVPLLIIGLVVFFTIRSLNRAGRAAAVRIASPSGEGFGSTRESLANLLTELDPDMPVTERLEMLAEFGFKTAPAAITLEPAAEIAAFAAAAHARQAPVDEAPAHQKKSKKQKKAHGDRSDRPPRYEPGALDAFAPFAALEPRSPMAPLRKLRPLAIQAPHEPTDGSAAYAARSFTWQ